jgi:tetratricopeptide (TPR) repeat protein
MSPGNSIFISHNAADRAYAGALKQAFEALVGSRELIDVRSSTSEDAGPEGGEAWREWIYRRVVEARTTLIVVTPHALGKPWLLWEAGAVKGAALARRALQDAAAGPAARDAPKTPSSATIVSLAYGLPDSECPDPLRGEQIIQGTDLKRLAPVFRRILQAHGIEGDLLFEAGTRMEQALDQYLESVRAAMKRAPSLVNEANVQDWLKRLDELEAKDRLSELGGFERWVMLAFGRDTDEDAKAGGIPIDVRLHRRLGELHLRQRQYRQAVRQLRLAWRAAPRDIFILRPLAEASMKRLLDGNADSDVSARDEIQTLLDAIASLDEHAYTATPEAAGLLAKYYRRVVGDLEKALDVYEKALEINPNSYYLADLVGQTELELGHDAQARAHFERALQITQRLDECNIWTHATAATALVGLARIDEARDQLTKLRSIEPPSDSQFDSIARGIREVAQRSGISDAVVTDLLRTLDPRRSEV